MLPIILHELDPILIESWKNLLGNHKNSIYWKLNDILCNLIDFYFIEKRDHFWVRISCFKFAFDLLIRFDGNLIAWRVDLKVWRKISSIFHSSWKTSDKELKKISCKNSIEKSIKINSVQSKQKTNITKSSLKGQKSPKRHD